MATPRASELPVIIVSGADSPRSRIGRGLESIGGLTAETLQRISTAVGGVMKSPVVLMTKVGGLASPRAATLTSPPGSSLEERVYHLEIQMKNLEERFNSMAVVTELDVSPHSQKEKPRIAKSLLQEMETDRTLVKRVQMLEDRANERMERFEKALSSIQSRLDHIELSRRETVAGFEPQESLSCEPQYYDAEQQSDNFGEAVNQNFWGAHDVPGEGTGGSPTLRKLHLKETSFAAPTTAKHVESLQETDSGKNDDLLEPQEVSTPVYSKEAFLTQPMKVAVPSSEPAESVHRDDASCLPASSEQQLASTLAELHGSFVTESSAAAASAKFLEIAGAVTAEKSTLAHASSEPQSTSALEEPREAFPEEPSAAVPVAKSEEHTQEDTDDKSGTSTFEATQKDITKEPLAAALDAKIAQELATQGAVIIALPSSETPVTSKSVEAPSVAVPSANSEELAQEDTGDKSVTMTAAREPPKEDFVKEPLASAPGAGPTNEPSSQGDLSTPSDTALSSSETPVASKFVEEPSTADPSASFEKPAQEEAAGESSGTVAAAEMPSAPSLKGSQEESESPVASKSVEEPSTADPSANFEEPAQEEAAGESGGTVAAAELPSASSLKGLQEESESPVAFKSVEEPSTADPSASFEKPAQEEAAGESSGTVAAAEMPSAPSLKGSQEESESPVASKSVEEPSTADPSANFEEPAQEEAAGESGGTVAAAELPSASSLKGLQEESESPVASKSMEEPSTADPSANFEEPAQEEAAGENGGTVAAAELPSVPSLKGSQEESESPVASKSVEEPSTADPSANFEEPAQEEAAGESGGTVAVGELPSAPSLKGPQEESESPVASKSVEEPSTADPSANFEESAQEEAAGENGGAVAAAELPSAPSLKGPQEESESPVASKSVEEPSTADPSANFEEPAQEEAAGENGSTAAAAELPSAPSLKGPQEEFESPVASKSVEEPSTADPSANFEEPAQEEAAGENGGTVAAAKLPSAPSLKGPQEEFESPVASKSVEEPSTADPSANFEEPAQEEAAGENGGIAAAAELPSAPSLKEPQEEFESPVASKSVEEPSTADPSANFEESAQEEAAGQSGGTVAVGELPSAPSLEGPQEESVKELTPSAESPQVQATQEDNYMQVAAPDSQIASQFVEEPSAVAPSADSEKPTQEDVADKIGTTMAATEPSLASSFEEPKEDFEKESLAAAPIHEPSSLEDSGATSDKALASSQPPVASKFVEEPSSDISSVNSEEPTKEDGAIKSDTVIADAKSPSVSSFEDPHKEKESMATAPDTEPTQELATQEDSDMAPFEPQVASKFVEESPAKDVPSAKFEEDAHENIVDKSGSATTAIESPSTSSLEAHKEDHTKESLEAGASAKVLEPTEEDESGESPIAFAPLEAPSPSFFGIPEEASSKEPSGTSVQPKELVQEKSGIVLPSADSTLAPTVEEDNHAMKEVEGKFAEDFKVHEQTKSIEREFPRSQSNLAHVGSEESFATEDSGDRLESDQSDETFFEVENDSGSFESWESDEPGEATGINAVAEKETLVPAPSVKPDQAPVREPAQGLEQAPARELEREPDQVPARELEQEPDQAPAREREQEPNLAPASEREREPDQASARELEQDHEGAEQAHAQVHDQQPAQEPEQEDLTRNSALALSPSESQVASKSGESQERLAEEPLAAEPSTKFEEPPQANAADESSTLDSPLTSPTEEPQIDSAGSLEKSLSSASFQQSGNPELSENLEHESSDTPGTSSTPQETIEKEPLTAAPTTEISQGHDAGRSDNVHRLLEPQLEESKEAPTSESTEPAQEQSDARLASSKPQSIPTLEEPQEGFVKEPSADAKSESKSVDLEESLADESSAVPTSAKLAQESVADKTSAGPVEESPLTSIAEEPQGGSMSSQAESKHVKFTAEPIEEVIPRTQSDVTHVQLNPEAADDATKLQSQGSFLAFGATSADSEEVLAKEPLPSAKLLELFEEENNSGKSGPILVDSPMTSTVEEPQKPLVGEPLTSAKSVSKGHFRRRGFARSSSEPQFAYKLEEHRKALAKESSVAAIPSASKLGEDFAPENFGDTQCLPFRILGEGKHPQKESEFKLAEDVKSPATKSEITSSPYVLEPRPSRIKLKKKKEKKEKKPDATAEEKERRLSLGLGEMERKSSLRAEEKDSKYSPRAEEKHRQHFRHLRDRLRHAFSINKEP